MVYLAYIAMGLAGIQLLIALSNLVFRQNIYQSAREYNHLVSVLIPARNEEKNIASLLGDLQKQAHQNIEILVFNDLSTDKTARVVKQFCVADKRIRLINSTGLPKGWLGKNFACHTLAQHATGSFLLFLDADVRISKSIIAQTIWWAERHQLGLLSVFPKQIMKTVGEQITVPVMNYILLSLLPLALVQKLKFASLAAANGQFMLFRTGSYIRYLPHWRMKNKRVEDIEIARWLKQNRIGVACLTGSNSITCRMYQSFGQAVSGFSKNTLAFFGNSGVTAILFWLLTTFGFLPVLLALHIRMLLLYLAFVFAIRVLVSVTSRQPVAANIMLLIPQQVTLGIIIYKAIQNSLKRQHQWKGRDIL